MGPAPESGGRRVIQSMNRELTDSSLLTRRMVSASSSAMLTCRILWHWLAASEHDHVSLLESRFDKDIVVTARADFHCEQYEIHV